MAFIKRGVDYFCRLAFPPKCAACRKILTWRTPKDAPPEALCEACARVWTSEMRETCGVCTLPIPQCACMPEPMQKAGCEALYKLVYYDPQKSNSVQNRMIYHIKRERAKRTVSFFADSLSSTVDRFLAQHQIAKEDAVITYLPRGRAARLANGTDQAYALARTLSRKTEIPMETLIKRRSGRSREQKRLTLAMRLENAKRAYVARQDAECKGKTVILVDDIVTTGASMAACAILVRRMGAARVFGVAVAADACLKDPMNKKFTENRVFL